MIWATTSTYLLHKEVGLSNAFYKLNFWSSTENENLNVTEDLKFIEDIVVRYYKVDQATSVSDKINLVKNNFSEDLLLIIAPRIKTATANFVKNNGTQEVVIQSISYDKESNGIYKIMAKVNQKISEDKTSNFDIHLTLKLKHGKEKTVVFWQEEIGLTISKDSKNQMSLAIRKPLEIKFPCRLTNVLPLSQQNSVEYKVNSDSDSIIFELTKGLKDNTAKFRVLCEKTKFDLDFDENNDRFVVLNEMDIQNGSPIQRKLSPQEKMNLSIKKQLIEMGLVE